MPTWGTPLLLLLLLHLSLSSSGTVPPSLHTTGQRVQPVADVINSQKPVIYHHVVPEPARLQDDEGIHRTQHDVRGGGGEGGGGHGHEEEHHSVHLAAWRWSEYSSPIMFTAMILSAAVLKIIFHHLPWLAKLLPESCVLIVVGIIAAVFIHYVILDEMFHLNDRSSHPFPVFTSDLFFNVLLPPIILDSALALYDRDFFDNFASIMIFAVFGTLFNVFSIGYSLYGLASSGLLGEFVTTNSSGGEVVHHLVPTECLIFSSLISAVDPVAVLAIFEEIQVNQGLYFLVFGESLFNDGVTVVLYNTMNTLLQVTDIGWHETMMAVLAFFFVAFGGALIGFINGLFASYITKYTKHVRVVEPLVIFSSAYFAFLTAELVHWSGIISIIAYGITVKRYGFPNLSKKSYTTVKYAIKTLASTSDCIIFLFLGVVLIQERHYFHVGFIVATIILCFVFRFMGVFLFSALVNLRRLHQIELTEQVIMGYGGLRGAVGFSLAVVLQQDVWYRELFVSAALAMVFFTVFLQGSTIKLLVKCLEIRLNKDEEVKLTCDINGSVIADIMNGVETIIGRKTKAKGAVFNIATLLDKSLKDMFGMEEKKDLLRKYEKIMLDEHFTNLYAPRILAKQQESEVIGRDSSQFSFADTRKSFQNGIRSSNWEKFRNHKSSETPDIWSVVNQQLAIRAERAKTMESQILKPEIRVENEDVADTDPSGRPPLSRSASANWAGLRRASRRAVAMKAEYDKVQQEKRTRSPTGRSLTIQTSIQEEPGEEMELLATTKQRHVTTAD